VTKEYWHLERPAAALTVVCLPHAGAGAGPFRAVAPLLPDDVSLMVATLPGRDHRLDEPFPDTWRRLLSPLLPPLMAVPSALLLWGHSMGALVAFELARHLERMARPAAGVCLSGMAAPHVSVEPRRSHLSDEQLWQVALGLGGVSPDLQDGVLKEVILPVLRSDFRLVEDYRLQPGMPLTAPVLLVAGSSDAEASPADVAAWRELCAGPVTTAVLPGGHFAPLERAKDQVSLLLDRTWQVNGPAGRRKQA